MLFVLAGTFSLFPSFSFAQFGGEESEEGLEYLLFEDIPVVTVASLTEESLEKAAGIVSVITAGDIRRLGARNILDVIDLLPGMELGTDFQSPRLLTIRGAGGTVGWTPQVRIMQDGIPMNTLLIGEGMGQSYFMPMDEVARIEIIRGPGSSLYGENALTGVINIIGKTGENEEGVVINASAGDFGFYKLNVQYGINHDDFKLFIGISTYETDGPEPLIKQDILFGSPISLTPGDGQTAEESTSAYINMSYNNWHFVGRVTDRVYEFLTGVTTGTLVDTTNSDTEWYNFGLDYTLQGDQWSLKPYAHYVYYDALTQVIIYPPGFGLPFDTNGDGFPEFFPDGVRNLVGTTVSRIGTGVTFTYDRMENQSWVMGVSYDFGELENYKLEANFHPLFFSSLGTFVDFTDTLPYIKDTERTLIGVFAQDKIQLSDALILTLGVRFDDYDDIGSSFNPRISVVWTTSEQMSFKFLAGSAFRVPNGIELFTTNNPVLSGNEDLDSEEIITYEAAVYYKPDREGALLAVNVFYNVISDLIRLSVGATGIGNYANIAGEQEYWGLEVEYKDYFAGWVSTIFSYSFVDGENDDGSDIDYMSHHKFTAQLNMVFSDHWLFNISSFTFSEKERAITDSRDKIDPSTVVNANLIWHLKPVEISISVHDLLDEQKVSPDATGRIPFDFPLSAREIRGKVTVHF